MRIIIRVALLSGVLLIPVRASIVQILSAQNLNMVTDQLLTIPQPPGTVISSPFSVSLGGEAATFSQASGLPFLVVFAGDDGTGTMGANFLYNRAALTGVPSQMQIAFSVPLVEFGIEVINNTPPPPGTQLFTFGVFQNANLLGTFQVSGPSTSVSFFGIQATAGDMFNRITISSNSNDFAVCGCQIAIQQAPEPAYGLPVAAF